MEVRLDGVRGHGLPVACLGKRHTADCGRVIDGPHEQVKHQEDFQVLNCSLFRKGCSILQIVVAQSPLKGDAHLIKSGQFFRHVLHLVVQGSEELLCRFLFILCKTACVSGRKNLSLVPGQCHPKSVRASQRAKSQSSYWLALRSPMFIS